MLAIPVENREDKMTDVFDLADENILFIATGMALIRSNMPM